MKDTITRDHFKQAILKVRPDNFSPLGLEVLFEYLVQLEEDLNFEIEFDPIGLCCEFTEYEDLEEFHGDYSKEEYPDLEALRDHTQVLPFTRHGRELDSFIIQDF